MANYCCAIRTNYFRVKDEEKFRELMSRVYGSEDEISLFEEVLDNQRFFGFGLYGSIAGLCNENEDEDEDVDDDDYDAFIDALQRCVADDDAIIILESGNEKLRYIIGGATIITSRSVEYVDITSVAMDKAAKMLDNPNWKTRCEY